MTQGVLNADKERHWGKQPTRLAQTASNLSISFLTFGKFPSPSMQRWSVFTHQDHRRKEANGDRDRVGR